MTALDDVALRELQSNIGADAATMRELFGAFLEQAPKLLEEGRVAIPRGDARTLLRVAHTIKSSAAMFGATDLARMCRELERDCGAGLPADAAGRLSAIETEYAGVSAALTAWQP